jgi:hypothetical protein
VILIVVTPSLQTPENVKVKVSDFLNTENCTLVQNIYVKVKVSDFLNTENCTLVQNIYVALQTLYSSVDCRYGK